MTAARKSTAVALLCTAVLFSPALFTVADAAAQQGAQTVEITFTKWFTRNADVLSGHRWKVLSAGSWALGRSRVRYSRILGAQDSTLRDLKRFTTCRPAAMR